MITLPSLKDLPSKWNEIRERLETDFSDDLEALMHERFTEHEAKQFEQDFIDRIGCAPEEYVRIRRAIRMLEASYPDSPNELTTAAIATPLGEWSRKLLPSKKPCADGLCFGKMSECNFCGRNWTYTSRVV